MSTAFRNTLVDIRDAGRSVVVVGLGVTGVETALFLRRSGIGVVCVEKQTEVTFRERSKFSHMLEQMLAQGVRIHFGIDGEKIQPLLDNVALAVLSPGVPLESSVVGALSRADVPYVSELELGVQLHGGASVVVTGSNGKSTTVSLIDHILKVAKQPSYLCGNVGMPVIASQEISLTDADSGSQARSTLVVEASSYQLEACTVMTPTVSVILNITENHLERHGTLDRYAAAKARVLRLQGPSATAILNADDPITAKFASSTAAKCAYFGTKPPKDLAALSPRWAAIEHGAPGVSAIVVGWRHADDRMTESRLDVSRAHLIGLHNRYNMAAAALAAFALGIDAGIVEQALNSFIPLEHRLELVGKLPWGTVINDSKSTTVAASVAAFSTVRSHFADAPIRLLIGGLSKAGSWAPLIKCIEGSRGPRRPVICFGKDGPLLASHLRSRSIDHEVVPTLRDAVTHAKSASGGEGEVVLLSPGCASFDEFSDFEHRGREFKGYVIAG